MPPEKVKEIDRIQDAAVEDMVAIAKELEAQMLEARRRIVARFDQALTDIAKAGKVTREQWKGNATLRSYRATWSPSAPSPIGSCWTRA